MHLCLFEDDRIDHLLPLVHLRAVYDLRLGIRTLFETTRDAFDATGVLLHARRSVAAVTGQRHELPVDRMPEGLGVLFVNGRYVAEEGDLLERLRGAARAGEPARAFVQDGVLVAAWTPEARPALVDSDAITPATFDGMPHEEVEGAHLVGRLWHLIDGLHDALERDYVARTRGYRVLDHDHADVHPSAVLVEPERVYLAPGARLHPGVILDAVAGPVFVGRDAVVLANAVVRGPASIGPSSQVKVAADVSGSALGPVCKAGGQVEHSIMHGFANKAHPGFLGNSYVGAWCNLGADTNTSNLRNDYGEVSLYDEADGTFAGTGRRFMGLVMADHSKSGINTMFNTGTVVGVSCNVYGCEFPPRRLPSFSWGSPTSGFSEFRLPKALAVAEAMMARRDRPLTEADRELMEAVFEATRADREGFAR